MWEDWNEFLILSRLKILTFQLKCCWMKSYPAKFRSFQRKIVQMGTSKKLQNSIQTLIILWLVFPIHANSVLGDIWRATILPFSSSEYLYSWLRLSNLVDLSFEYLSLSNKRKTTTLLPSPLTFLQWPMNVKWQMVVRVSVNIWLEIMETDHNSIAV